jgi:hypothetical protein
MWGVLVQTVRAYWDQFKNEKQQQVSWQQPCSHIHTLHGEQPCTHQPKQFYCRPRPAAQLLIICAGTHRIAPSLPTDNCPQPKEAQPRPHALTPSD